MLGPSVVFWPAGTSWDGANHHVVFGGDFRDANDARVGEIFHGGGGVFDVGDDHSEMMSSDALSALRKCLDRTGATHVQFVYPTSG